MTREYERDEKGQFASTGSSSAGAKGPAGDSPVRTSDTRAEQPATSRVAYITKGLPLAKLSENELLEAEKLHQSIGRQLLVKEGFSRYDRPDKAKNPDVAAHYRRSEAASRMLARKSSPRVGQPGFRGRKR